MTSDVKIIRANLTKEITNFIRYMHQLFKNNYVLARSIDEAYSTVIAEQIQLIPNDWIKGTYKTWMMLKGIASCIDFVKMNEVIKENCSKIWFTVDTYKFITNHMFRVLDIDDSDRQILANLMKIFIPLCRCIDHITAHPEEFIQRLADLSQTTENDSIF